jgi:hypothetical protein
MTDMQFNDDRHHNLVVLNSLIKQASPPCLHDYFIHGYVDDDFVGYSDYKSAIAYVLSRLLATKPVPRIVKRAVHKALTSTARRARCSAKGVK